MKSVIHQMWFQGKSEQPQCYAKNVQSWISNNPAWGYMYWDERSLRRLIRSEYSEYLDRWEKLDKIIKKCDAARYFVLHRHGGVYADLDTHCFRPIDALISEMQLENCNIVFAEESQDIHNNYHWKAHLREMIRKSHGPSKFVGNAIILSEPKQKFWLEFLDRGFAASEATVLESFSTWHLSKYLSERRYTTGVKVLEFDRMLSPVFVDGVSYFTHSYDAAWFNHQSQRPWEG